MKGRYDMTLDMRFQEIIALSLIPIEDLRMVWEQELNDSFQNVVDLVLYICQNYRV